MGDHPSHRRSNRHAAKPNDDVTGCVPPEKAQDADRWAERINAAIQDRLHDNARS
jgi:hypothetical protein